MTGQIKQQPVYIPTGYEGIQQSAAQKRKLAEMMYGAGQTANPISIAQVLGDLGKFWVGRDADRQADKLELDYKKQLGESYNARWTDFNADRGRMTPQQLVEKYGNDPFMQEALKPYTGALETGLKEKEQYRVFGGKLQRTGDIPAGAYDNKPSDRVIGVNGPDGPSWQLNPVSVAGARAAQGFGTDGLPTAMADPGASYSAPSPPIGAVPTGELPASGESVLTMEQINAAASALGPEGTRAWLTRNPNFVVKVATPEQADSLPSGTNIQLPDGTLGKVP